MTNLFEYFLMGTTVQFERSFYFRNVYTQCMLVEFGTSCLACYGLYFGNGKQQFLCLTTNLIRLFQ